MFNIDKRVLAELRKECLEIERKGAPDLVEDNSELSTDMRALFDSVVAFATDDELAQIDAFFEQKQTGKKMSAAKDKEIKAAIRNACGISRSEEKKGNLSLADRLGLRPAAVAFRSSDKTADEKTLKAVNDFARELLEEDDPD